MIFNGIFLVAGEARGPILATAPLSFWGGYDPEAGRVIDRSHPALGAAFAGRILVMPSGRGSSSSSTVLAEAIRLGTAPAAIVLSEPDPILVIGALVAHRLYRPHLPDRDAAHRRITLCSPLPPPRRSRPIPSAAAPSSPHRRCPLPRQGCPESPLECIHAACNDFVTVGFA